MIPIELASGLLVLWPFGGLVARVGGLVLLFVGVVNLALGPRVGGVALTGAGAVIWLFGHWHYALRHHAYKSPLARYVFSCWAPGWLDATRNWAVPVADAERSPGGQPK